MPLFTFDFVGVKTIEAKDFEEARRMIDGERPQNFDIQILETSDHRVKGFFSPSLLDQELKAKQDKSHRRGTPRWW